MTVLGSYLYTLIMTDKSKAEKLKHPGAKRTGRAVRWRGRELFPESLRLVP